MARDLVWITLESVRQDHTSLGGYDRDTTPFLRTLSARPSSATFTNCFSHDIWTRSSSASILTGLTPSAHRTWSEDARLSRDIPTIPEALRDAGYRTVCVSPNPQLSEVTGLARGFDHFHYLGKSTLLREAGLPTMIRYLAGLNRHSAGFTRDTPKHSLGYLNVALARRHVDAVVDDGDPLFLYVHLGDSHHPYYPPKPYQNRFADGFEMSTDEALAVSMDMSADLHGHIARGVPFADDEWNAIHAMYDAGICHVDETTRRIIDYAEARLDDPIVVVTSDHGELLGERGLLAHMITVNDAVSHVPLVVSGVSGLAGTYDGIVQHADAMRTVLTEAGVEADVPVGVDLRDESREFAVTQRGGARAAEKLDTIGILDPSFDAARYHVGDLTSLRTPEYRYAESDSGRELFELPDETYDVGDERPDVRDDLTDRCASWLATFGTPRSQREERSEFDDSMAAHLKDLGYL